jgi:hypothetical protein
MILHPKKGDIVYLCLDVDFDKFTYYGVGADICPIYKAMLEVLAKGHPGKVVIARNVDRMGSDYDLIIGHAKCLLYVSVHINDCNWSSHFPDWMLSREPYSGCMVRNSKPETTRMM